ncbi:putative cytochrome P450 hydroxylase [Actinokineospora spheciospongiae]|uniref:Putative cytochrome P450 hydroxylase n=1 Tax=Actinokineospora spheciospongiae TaxID=909613 RepID=W7J9Y7_9PSEU|nr:cytochrome P450 [Actinokineospora spheciospongiae]EWC62854.1 putative cytochrome P450 hydroxylase [Actinokineospora spheciospongiae]
MSFDPADPAFLADPYPVFAALRAEAEVHDHPGLGLAVAVSHAASSAVLRERSLGRLWTDAAPVAAFAEFNLLHRNSLLESEPPTHTRLRRLVAAAFGRGHTERLRPRVEALAAGLVEELAERVDADGSADLLAVLAAPLPIQVIGELLGVPESERGLLQPWSNAIVKMYEYDLAPDLAAAAERAAGEFAAYLRTLVAHRRAHPGDDLVSDLVAVRDGTDRLSEDELVATAVLLLMAGHEATVNVVGNGVHALLTYRDQWELLLADPALLPSAVEELIRFDAPLQLFERTATAPVTIAGHRVEPGAKVAALLGAAARDPAVFTDPDRLDITRSPNPHLGFGAGIHYCVGAPLARVEVSAALKALTARLPGLVGAGAPERRPEFVIRGLEELPVGV